MVKIPNYMFFITSDVDNCVKCPEDKYANTEQNKCIPKAVTFLTYEEPLGMALSLMTL